MLSLVDSFAEFTHAQNHRHHTTLVYTHCTVPLYSALILFQGGKRKGRGGIRTDSKLYAVVVGIKRNTWCSLTGRAVTTATKKMFVVLPSIDSRGYPYDSSWKDPGFESRL